MKHLLLIHHSQTGRTATLIAAACEGASALSSEVEIRSCKALEATLDDLLWANGLLIGTPENFGYMSGAVKDFLDRTYYPAEGLTTGLPYALMVSASNDGTGAVRALERIAAGYGWRPIAEAMIVKGEPDAKALTAAQELGAAFAAGLASGVF